MKVKLNLVIVLGSLFWIKKFYNSKCVINLEVLDF